VFTCCNREASFFPHEISDMQYATLLILGTPITSGWTSDSPPFRRDHCTGNLAFELGRATHVHE
jgi:hypothetical protein